MSDHDSNSPYNVDTVSCTQVMRMKKIINFRESLIDLVSNSRNLHVKNCMTNSKENYQPLSLRVKWRRGIQMTRLKPNFSIQGCLFN